MLSNKQHVQPGEGLGRRKFQSIVPFLHPFFPRVGENKYHDLPFKSPTKFLWMQMDPIRNFNEAAQWTTNQTHAFELVNAIPSGDWRMRGA